MLPLFKRRGGGEGQKRARELSPACAWPLRVGWCAAPGPPPGPCSAAQLGPHRSLPLGCDRIREHPGASLCSLLSEGGTARPGPSRSHLEALPAGNGLPVVARPEGPFSAIGFLEAGHPVQERPPVQFTHCRGFGGVSSVGGGTARPGAGHTVQGKWYHS